MYTELGNQRQAFLITHGALLFAGGLLAGLALTFSLLGHFEIWPLIGKTEVEIPGSSRAWLRTHLGLIMNGLAVWVFALIAGRILLSEGQQKLYIVSVLITAWFNSAGFLIGTLFGVHGLSFGGNVPNTLTYLFFLIAVVTVFIQIALVLLGARRLSQA